MSTVNVFEHNSGLKDADDVSIIISYLPKYLNEFSEKFPNMSKYDAMTCYTLEDIFSSCLVNTNPLSVLTYSEQRDELLERYYLNGDYVFNDTTITIDDEVAFEFKGVKELEPNVFRVIVVVGNGCTKCAIDRSPKDCGDILKWLMRNMVKRLGINTVTKSSVFRAYWLK